MRITTKNLVFISAIILCILISSHGVFSQEDRTGDLGKTQNVVRDLICMLFWVMPFLALLFSVAGGVLIVSGSAENRVLGKKFTGSAIIVLIIIMALMLFVYLALPDVDIMVCFGVVPQPGNQPPMAEGRVSYYENPTPSEKSVEITMGDMAYFDASLSKDPDGAIVRYIWDFDDGTYDEGTPVEHTYTTLGEYYVKLRVVDDMGVISPIPSTVRVIVNPPLDVRGEVIPAPPKTTTTSTVPPWVTTTTSTVPPWVTTTTSTVPPWVTTTTIPDGTTTTTSGSTTTTTPGSTTTTTTLFNCLDFRSCQECIAAGCQWCQDPTMGPSHCISDCGLTCHGGSCYTVDCSFPVTTTTTTSTTTTLDITCDESYAYDCKGYCDDPSEICETVDDHCECKEYVTACDEFKATGVLPEKFDWRDWKGKNYMTLIKNQASCGSCWAFSVVGAVEGTYKVEQWNSALNPDLSEQNLVSNCCSAGSCNGGWPDVALSYIKNSRIVDENCFSYQSMNCQKRVGNAMVCLAPCICGSKCSNPCSCDRCSDYINKEWTINNYGSAVANIKMNLICKGPLSVASMNWRHAIVLAGYDDDSSICKNKYGKSGCWIIKNSWGVFTGFRRGLVWHENGYGYIPYTGHSYSDVTNYAYYAEDVKSP